MFSNWAQPGNSATAEKLRREQQGTTNKTCKSARFGKAKGSRCLWLYGATTNVPPELLGGNGCASRETLPVRFANAKDCLTKHCHSAKHKRNMSRNESQNNAVPLASSVPHAPVSSFELSLPFSFPNTTVSHHLSWCSSFLYW